MNSNGKKPAVSTAASGSTSEATTGASDTAPVQPPAPAAPEAKEAPEPVPNHGRGGLYTVVNGVRQRVGGTQAIHDVKKG